MMSQKNRSVNFDFQFIGWLVFAFLVYILLYQWIKKAIWAPMVAVFSLVPDNSIWMQISLILLIALTYLLCWRHLRNIRKWRIHVYRNCFMIFAVVLYFHALILGDYEFYGLQELPLNYIEVCFIVIWTCELAIWIWYIMQNKRWVEERSRLIKELEDVPEFCEDSPKEEDELERHPQAIQLVDMIKKTALQEDRSDAFSILVSEPYGYGKTSFLLDIQSLAKSEKIPYVWLKPWNLDDHNTMTANFISSLAEIYGDIDYEISSKIQKYASLFKAHPYGEIVYNFFNRKPIKTIESRSEEICDCLKQQRRPIIVFVDDVDRLQYQELMSVLGLIRNTVNFPYIYYIVACDKVAASHTLMENGILNPAEYFKKFFNFELFFVANDESVMAHLKQILHKEILQICQGRMSTRFIDNAIDDLCRIEYIKTIMLHLRDVKRYANIVAFSLSMMKRNGMLNEIYLPDLLSLLLIQYLSPDIYRILRDHGYLLLKLDHRTFHLREEASDVFSSRSQEKDLATWLKNYLSESDNSKPTKPTLDKDNLSGATFIRTLDALRPTEAEQIGSLLQHLFTISPKHNGIANPGDYFKYFADKYKQQEVSNAQIEWLMQTSLEGFKDMALPFVSEDRFMLFNDKLQYFLYHNVSYNRVDVLRKLNVLRIILETRGKEIYMYENYIDHWIREVCSYKYHKDEENMAYEQEMEQLSTWLMNESDWKFILVFCAAIKSGEEGQLMIFREDQYKLFHVVQQRFFADKIFNDDLSNIEILERWNDVMNYDQCNFKQLLEQNISQMTNPRSLYYRAVYIEGNAWKVNEQFCNFTNIYLNLVARELPMLADMVLPVKECEDLLSLRSSYPIVNNKIELNKHPFLKSASDWWNAHPEEKEKMAWMYKHN